MIPFFYCLKNLTHQLTHTQKNLKLYDNFPKDELKIKDDHSNGNYDNSNQFVFSN